MVPWYWGWPAINQLRCSQTSIKLKKKHISQTKWWLSEELYLANRYLHDNIISKIISTEVRHFWMFDSGFSCSPLQGQADSQAVFTRSTPWQHSLVSHSTVGDCQLGNKAVPWHSVDIWPISFTVDSVSHCISNDTVNQKAVKDLRQRPLLDIEGQAKAIKMLSSFPLNQPFAIWLNVISIIRKNTIVFYCIFSKRFVKHYLLIYKNEFTWFRIHFKTNWADKLNVFTTKDTYI